MPFRFRRGIRFARGARLNVGPRDVKATGSPHHTSATVVPVLLVLGFLLTGCLEDQKRSMAQCREVQHAAGTSLTISEEARATELCMKTAGYELTADDDECAPVGGLVQALDARCYKPTNLFSRWVTMIESAWAG
jgi:hypothetical protein